MNIKKFVTLLILLLFNLYCNMAHSTEIDTSQVIEKKINTVINSNNLSSDKLKDNSAKILNWITALSTVSAVLASLYLGYWKEKFQKPKLKIEFSESKPYIRKVAFDSYNKYLHLDNARLLIFRPGINVRIKVLNTGRTLAKDIKARLEKIVFFKNNNSPQTIYYHPTDVKWSGQKDWREVDIAPNSSFFLDAFWIKNETLSEVITFNQKRYENYSLEIDNEIFKSIIKSLITNRIYWSVWIDYSFDRGIPKFYEFEGKFQLHYVISGNNCKPVSLVLEVVWEKGNWDNPSIAIRKKRKD